MNFFRPALLAIIVVTTFPAEPLPYSPAPNDTYWLQQWYLENLGTNGVRQGIDIAARGAWPQSKGEGITIAIVDDGVELAHPELINRQKADLHWNFESDSADGSAATDAMKHGTPVAGLAVAEANNERGISGIAPEARFASWVIYKTNSTGGPFVSSNQLAKMFTFHSNEVQVQNHSWVKPNGDSPVTMSAAEDQAISDAVSKGREGRGVVMVRAGGNDRLQGRNANDDAYISDARAIAVAALRLDGVIASYSDPGASILVCAPGGETGSGTLFTTDRLGKKGYNQISFTNDLADYVFESLGFSGTSAAAPLISGTVALMLSKNPSLSYRDVQQILLLSAYQTNPNDDYQQTGAGLIVSHNSGYGLVSAATAVDMASRWKNRPPLTSAKVSVEGEVAIPDAGLTVAVEPIGGEMPNLLMTALPGLGMHVDAKSAVLPIVYVGDGSEPITVDLTGKAALMQRGNITFAEKIVNAAKAGALFAVIFDNQGTNQIQLMGSTDYVPIPAVSISRQDGETLTNIIGSVGARAQIRFDAAQYKLEVPDSLLCEHVKVTLKANHEQRGDMRVTLTSPAGTQSILQRIGKDLNPFPGEWTYMTTHHFYESSQGTWTFKVGDEVTGGTGTVHSATLEILGVPIKDADHDGLDDDWEMAHLGSLSYGPLEDSDLDGYSNAREQILGTDPTQNESPLALGVARWNDSILRLNWPSRAGVRYEVLGRSRVDDIPTVVQELSGGFPRSTWFGPMAERFRYFTVREKQ